MRPSVYSCTTIDLTLWPLNWKWHAHRLLLLWGTFAQILVLPYPLFFELEARAFRQTNGRTNSVLDIFKLYALYKSTFHLLYLLMHGQTIIEVE